MIWQLSLKCLTITNAHKLLEFDRNLRSTYIYIYILISLNIIDIFCLHIFFWIRSYCRIRRELIYVLSIVVCISSTFCPTLGHYQGRIYYKSDVTFVFAYYYYVIASLVVIYSSNMRKQMLHHFCNRSSSDDGPKLGRKY